MRLNHFACAAALLAATAAALVPRRAEAKTKTLRFVPHADLKILDPGFTTAYISRNFGYMVYDTLFALDGNGKPQPQMVDSYTRSQDGLAWTFVLRPGLKFSDGKDVTAADAVASIERWAMRDPFGAALKNAGAQWADIDAATFRLSLKRPFDMVLDALSKPSSFALVVLPHRLPPPPTTPPPSHALLSGGGGGRAAARGAPGAPPRAAVRGRWLRPVSVQARRVGAGQQNRVRAQSRLCAAQGAAQRVGRQDRKSFRAHRVAVPAGQQQRRRRAPKGRGGFHREFAGRLHRVDANRPRHEPAVVRRVPGPAGAEPLAPAFRQSQGAAGGVEGGGPGAFHGGHRLPPPTAQGPFRDPFPFPACE